MEVRFISNEDYDKWNEFVDKSPQGFIWDYSWWVDIITKSDYKICALFDDDNIIVAGCVLPFYSTKIIRMPILTQSLGLLYEDMSKRNNMRWQKQLTTQKEYSNKIYDFIKKDFRYFSLCFHYNYIYWLPLYWKEFNQTTKYTYVIEYKDYVLEEEFKRFSKGHKWILNKVEKKSDLRVVKVDDVEEYINESDKTYKRQGIKKPYSNDLIRQLHKALVEHNMSTILKIVDSSNKIHAIEYYIHNKKETYYWLGASDELLRDSGGHTYLTWYAIKHFSDKVQYFNFGGSMLEYVERNFRNFSPQLKPYFLISKGKLPLLQKVLNNLYKFIRG